MAPRSLHRHFDYTDVTLANQSYENTKVKRRVSVRFYCVIREAPHRLRETRALSWIMLEQRSASAERPSNTGNLARECFSSVRPVMALLCCEDRVLSNASKPADRLSTPIRCFEENSKK